MKRNVGLWIDHRQAFIVALVDEVEETKRITSDVEKHVRYPVASRGSHDDTTEIRRDRQDRRFDDQLNSYYDKVITHLHTADSILIIGPGEAKGELKKRLEDHGLSDRIAATLPADKMTDSQIEAVVRQHFWPSPRDSIIPT